VRYPPVTRDEVLAWLDDHAGDPFSVSTEIAPGGVKALFLWTSGVLAKDAVHKGFYTVGDATIDVGALDDARIEGATPGWHHAQENLRIPLAGDVSIVIEDGIIESG
jgi:hypothetical protein